MRFLLIAILFLVNIYAALPPDVQDEIDFEQKKENIEYKKNATVILDVRITSVESSRGYFDSNKQSIVLEIQKLSVIKNINTIEIPTEISLSYTRFSPIDGWVGPKSFNIIIPKEDEIYRIYLDDRFELSARDESIEALDEDLSPISLAIKLNDKQSTIYYPLNSYVLDDFTRQKVEDIVFVFQNTKNNDSTIMLIGHSNKEGSKEKNNISALKIAQSLKDLLISHGIEATKIRIMSRSDKSLICNEDTESCKAKNHRVQVRIY